MRFVGRNRLHTIHNFPRSSYDSGIPRPLPRTSIFQQKHPKSVLLTNRSLTKCQSEIQHAFVVNESARNEQEGDASSTEK